MPLHVLNPFSVQDLTVRNTKGRLYVEGDEVTDLSVRILIGVDPLNVRLRARESGVWNNTGIETSGATWHVDHDLRVGGAGEDVRISNGDESTQALLLKMPYTDAEGSGIPTTPTLSALKPEVILQPDLSVDTEAALHQWLAPPQGSPVLVKNVLLKTGAQAATAPVTVDFYKSTFADPDELIFTQNYGVDKFPANSDVNLLLVGMTTLLVGEVVYHEIKSDVAFSLLGNSSLVPWHGHSDYDQGIEHLVTFETGSKAFLTSESGEMVIDEAGDMIYE